MAVDRARIAAALAREEQRRRLMESVPSTERGAPAPQSRNLRRDLENLSIGVGEGITNQLEGLKGIVTDPIGSAKAGYQAIRGIVRDPSVIADALRYTAQKAGSGPLGAGEVIGEMVSPIRGKAPMMREIDVYHGSPHRFEPEETLTVYRGENTANKGGNYWTGDPEFARQFTQSGLENEIKRSTLSSADVYTPPTPVFAGDAKAVDAAIAEARRLGKGAVRFSEGKGQPDSFYVVEKTALGRTGNPFGAFNASKIGTGEGAQAYGHGIYLAESPDVAKVYRSATDPVARRAEMTLQMTEGNVNEAIKFVQKDAKRYETYKNEWFFKPEAYQEKLNELEYLKQIKKGKPPEVGAMYKADLPDEMVDRMLDWDKPLSRQSREVQEFAKTQNPSLASEEPHFVTPSGEVIHWSALVDSVENLKNPKTKAIPSKIYGGGNWVKYGEHMMGQTTGGEFYRSLSSPSEWSRQAAAGAGKAGLDDVEASAALRGVGIPGIKYMDEGSRGYVVDLFYKGKPYSEHQGIKYPTLQSAQERIAEAQAEGFEPRLGTRGTRNFVVFPGEEKKVKILSRD